ncbi:hypothetical protein SAPIO_CDS8985 [Scedosporium apiospermum]|uniref:DNA-directed RNA polymerase subunit n=1 Tax=Pseudallescheria apiosperma TaxID=563466 RepID=A0A084FY39_PSEDA|nr:uncharacterized protein SAPIO_CDS8985 [Scedosporium apiospermum]KEZ40001.1 hypothetical protein SAPIO_CDS8985 [Scedosporium apiospermum]
MAETSICSLEKRTKIADLVQIAPEDFSKQSAVAIEDNINAKYSNKVIQNIGLCICFYDLLWASEGLIGHGTGLVNVNGNSTPQGIHLRTDFFDDIFVPYDQLPEGCEYNHSDQLWIWNVEEDRLYFDNHEMARIQVIDEEWHDQTPVGPLQSSEDNPPKPPYKITGSMRKEGLGPCLWWDG